MPYSPEISTSISFGCLLVPPSSLLILDLHGDSHRTKEAEAKVEKLLLEIKQLRDTLICLRINYLPSRCPGTSNFQMVDGVLLYPERQVYPVLTIALKVMLNCLLGPWFCSKVFSKPNCMVLEKSFNQYLSTQPMASHSPLVPSLLIAINLFIISLPD